MYDALRLLKSQYIADVRSNNVYFEINILCILKAIISNKLALEIRFGLDQIYTQFIFQ